MLSNLNTLCRLCTKNYAQLTSLYERDVQGISSEEKLKTICGIEINSDDVLPKTICKYCIKKLNNSYEFRNMCLDSIRTLAKLWEDCEQETCPNDDTFYYLEVDEDWLAENNLTKASLGLEDDTKLPLESNEIKHEEEHDQISNETNEDEKSEPDEKPLIQISDKLKTKKCRVCKKRFNSDTKVKLHMQRIHKEIYLSECKVSCYKCGMKFQHMRNLKRHMVYHNITFSYFECSFCQKKLYSKKSWRKHIKIHDKSINEICKICNKRLSSAVAKIYHMEYHRTKETLTNKTFFCCYTCNSNFTSFEELEGHISSVHSKGQNACFDEIERNFEKIFNEGNANDVMDQTEDGVNLVFKCNLCSLFYKKLTELKYHVSECFAKIDCPKSFMCDTCGKCFKSSWLLNNHKAGHSTLRKFICDICGQRFKWHNDLTNHVSRIHENIRPYVCKFCGKTCGTSATLKSHLRSHSKERPYTCKICNTSFAQNSSLKEHMFKHTGGQEGTCPICNKIFKTPLRLRTHMKRHNTQRVLYPCDLCGRMFTEKSSVKKHKIKIHNDQNENIE